MGEPRRLRLKEAVGCRLGTTGPFEEAKVRMQTVPRLHECNGPVVMECKHILRHYHATEQHSQHGRAIAGIIARVYAAACASAAGAGTGSAILLAAALHLQALDHHFQVPIGNSPIVITSSSIIIELLALNPWV